MRHGETQVGGEGRSAADKKRSDHHLASVIHTGNHGKGGNHADNADQQSGGAGGIESGVPANPGEGGFQYLL